MSWQYATVEACRFVPIPEILNELLAAYNERLESNRTPLVLSGSYSSSINYLSSRIRLLLEDYVNITKVADTMQEYPPNWSLEEFYATYNLQPLESFESQITFENLHTIQKMLSVMLIKQDPFEGEVFSSASGIKPTKTSTYEEMIYQLKYGENNETHNNGSFSIIKREYSGIVSYSGEFYLPEIRAEGFENRPCEVIPTPQLFLLGTPIQPFFSMDSSNYYYKLTPKHTSMLTEYTPILPYSRSELDFATVEDDNNLNSLSFLTPKYIYNYACEGGFAYQSLEE